MLWSSWQDASETEVNMNWTREAYAVLRPFLIEGAYGNYLSDEGESAARATYGVNYDRLANLKNKYDPTNFFRMNQNIKPTKATPAA